MIACAFWQILHKEYASRPAFLREKYKYREAGYDRQGCRRIALALAQTSNLRVEWLRRVHTLRTLCAENRMFTWDRVVR